MLPVQYAFDQLADAVMPDIAGLGHRDQGRRIHAETSSLAGRFRVVPPSPR